jgi:mannose-6-phosphate isomerase-like protein (cupin superfamily)
MKVNLAEKLSLFTDRWAPRTVAQLNDYEVKLVKVQGDFVWHSHAETDELFLVLRGHLRIDLRDGAIELNPGELYVVPKGVEHKPFAAQECEMLLVEPRGVVNTGNAVGELTALPRTI